MFCPKAYVLAVLETSIFAIKSKTIRKCVKFDFNNLYYFKNYNYERRTKS